MYVKQDALCPGARVVALHVPEVYGLEEVGATVNPVSDMAVLSRLVKRVVMPVPVLLTPTMVL